MKASYLLLSEEELKKRILKARSILENCSLCPRICGINRIKGERGLCKSGNKLKIASFNLHHGEEPWISGTHGSGTIFFSGCVLNCVFCQNYPISQFYHGKEYSVQDLAEIMLYLQKKEAHNINLVTPTHFMPLILEGLFIAIKKGLNIPIVYNTGGYELVKNITILENIVDIYLPDMKYLTTEISKNYSGVENYSINNIQALREMFKQVGHLYLEDGIAKRGLIIRHLVLPSLIKESFNVLQKIRFEFGNKIHLSIMAQYFPAYKTTNNKSFSNINRRITNQEYNMIVQLAEELGFENALLQELE